MSQQTRLRNYTLRRRSLGLAALAFGIVALTGCRGGGGEQKADKAATPASVKSFATQVSVVTATKAAIADTSEITGALNSLSDVMVSVKMSGKLVSVFGREGDKVKAGDVVAQLDTADLQAQLDVQRAALETARTRLSQAKVVYTNAQTTLKWTNEQTASAVRQADAQLKSAQDQAAIVKLGARDQEREQADQNVIAAKSDRDKARSDLKRYQELYRQQAISAQQLDQAQSVADSAEARYNSALQGQSLIKEGARKEDIRRAESAVEIARQGVFTARSNREQVNLRRQDIENARVGIQTAEAGVKQAEASVRLAQQALQDATVRSPINGVIAERKVEPGVQIAGAKPDVMRIVDLTAIYFDAQVSETQYAKIQRDQIVEVRVDALPGRTFKGQVSKLFPIASATARSFTVRIRIQNDGDLLRPQMFARGRVTLDTHPQAVVVPREAILDMNEKDGRVFVVTNGKAEDRKVKLGIVALDKVEIVSGVQAGDKVVTIGQGQLQKGDKVEVAQSTPASNGTGTP